ncbi:MAG: SDR family oxidoreductase [Sphingopyxis sp.]|nr:SDR family oxidoreductase [Sphingopyxis sp.]
MNVFLTGAAGLLGGALAAALVKDGHAVVALVHRSADIVGNDGQPLATMPYEGTAPLPGTVMVMRGDVRRHGLGFESEICAALDRSIDVVVHCAALVKFEADWSELEAANVAGTCHVAALLPKARFIHVSTAYVCGLKNGPIAETPCDPNRRFGNGYEKSKACAEAALAMLRPDAVIARPSIIVGEAASGRIRSFDTIYRAFKFIAEGKIAAVPVAPLATLNFVPVDHVVAAICDLVESPAANGRICHLAAKNSVSAADFLRLIGTIPGLACPAPSPSCPEPGRKMGIADRLARPYLQYFLRHPEFETSELSRLSMRAAPVMDDAALVRQIRYCVAAGFIRATKNLATPVRPL